MECGRGKVGIFDFLNVENLPLFLSHRRSAKIVLRGAQGMSTNQNKIAYRYLLIGMLIFFNSCQEKKYQKEQNPNIVLIILGDCGYPLSCYGEPEIQTPNIDQLASDGALQTPFAVLHYFQPVVRQ